MHGLDSTAPRSYEPALYDPKGSRPIKPRLERKVKSVTDPQPQLERKVLTGPGWHLNAIFGPDGKIQLWDIYIENRWIGSRRTEDYCYQELRNHGIEPFPG